MIKVTSMKLNTNDKTALVSLFADTASEVSGSAQIVGLPTGYTIEAGSTVITASAEVAFMQSTGAWNWV